MNATVAAAILPKPAFCVEMSDFTIATGAVAPPPLESPFLRYRSTGDRHNFQLRQSGYSSLNNDPAAGCGYTVVFHRQFKPGCYMVGNLRLATLYVAIALLAAVELAQFAPTANADMTHAVPREGVQQLQDLRARVQALEAREEIRILMHDYGRLLDARDFDGFAQLFAAQSEYDSAGTVTRGPQAIAASLQSIIGRNPLGFKTPNFHIFFNESIEVQGERGTAVSKSAFVVPGDGNQPNAVMLANYHDDFIRENGRWKFLRRRVRSDIPVPQSK
jgi:hypothetical protein